MAYRAAVCDDRPQDAAFVCGILEQWAGLGQQQGTHEQLLNDASGIYCALWNAQAQYYAEETA